MKYAIVIAAVVAATVLACTATDDRAPITDPATAPFHATLAEARAVAARVDRSIVVEFYTDW